MFVQSQLVCFIQLLKQRTWSNLTKRCSLLVRMHQTAAKTAAIEMSNDTFHQIVSPQRLNEATDPSNSAKLHYCTTKVYRNIEAEGNEFCF